MFTSEHWRKEPGPKEIIDTYNVPYVTTASRLLFFSSKLYIWFSLPFPGKIYELRRRVEINFVSCSAQKWHVELTKESVMERCATHWAMTSHIYAPIKLIPSLIFAVWNLLLSSSRKNLITEKNGEGRRRRIIKKAYHYGFPCLPTNWAIMYLHCMHGFADLVCLTYGA